MGCSMMCDCGNGGNPCNNTVGTCICNSCYSGTRCETGKEILAIIISLQQLFICVLEERVCNVR